MKQIINAITISLICILPLYAAQTDCQDHEHSHSETVINDSHSSECDDDHSEDSEHSDAITLTQHQIEQIGLKTQISARAKIDILKGFNTTIRLNEDKMANVVPKISGVVADISASLGSKVRAGETIAVIESKELVDIKTQFVSAVKTKELAKLILGQQDDLRKEKINTTEEFMKAKNDYAQASLQLLNAKEKLRLLGLSNKSIEALPTPTDDNWGRYEIKSPLDGVVVSRELMLGQFVEESDKIFTVAGTATLWADIYIPPTEIANIKTNQEVVINAKDTHGISKGKILYISPTVSQTSRTILVRAVVDNSDGRLRSGTFATAEIATDYTNAQTAVEAGAIVNIDNEKFVFVHSEEGFEPRVVITGASNGQLVEIKEGLSVGEQYVSKGAFELKSIIETSTLDPHAGHGH